MHLIEAMIAARMLIETNSVVVHVRRDLLLPCPLCQSRFFFYFWVWVSNSISFYFGFCSWVFWGFGSLRKKSGRRRGREEDGERMTFVCFVEE